ncbi:MAG: hypothetical protein HOO67_05415 [Candidatus Peribacteraceae bacterium]|nr:hypothetical protein [Candidatus Peribacteraceae bacterium]
MASKNLPSPETSFVARIRQLEERLFPDQLDDSDPTRMKSHGKYSWLYRPSHHIASGLLTQDDSAFLLVPGRRLLSVGSHPVFLEKILIEVGIPAENILVADVNPELSQAAASIPSVVFDMNEQWPDIGMFDLIIFPESLCIAIRDNMKDRVVPKDAGPHPTDALETELLTGILRQAIGRLRPGGIIRANGPMSHPKIVDAMKVQLQKEGFTVQIDYKRFLLTIRNLG